MSNPYDGPVFEVDCPGYTRDWKCPKCEEQELREDPPRCYGCDEEVDLDRVEACTNTATIGSGEHCGDCGYPAPDFEEPDEDDYDPLEGYYDR